MSLTPEQEAEMYMNIGSMTAKMDGVQKTTKEMADYITGNGTPENGLLFIIHDLQKIHRDCPVQTGAMQEQITALQTANKVDEGIVAGVKAENADSIIIKKSWFKNLPPLAQKAIPWILAATGTGATGGVVLNGKTLMKALLNILLTMFGYEPIA